jgi:hypothetical protein
VYSRLGYQKGMTVYLKDNKEQIWIFIYLTL